MAKRIVPIADKVMLSPVAKTTEEDQGLQMQKGIVIPENARVKEESPFVIAKVIGVGDECKIVKAGDEVLVNRNTIIPVELGLLEYWFIPEKQLFGVIRGLDLPGEKSEVAPPTS